MAERVVFMNGNFVSEQEARISIYDSALMFGDMVFEMTRSFKRRQFKLREHLIRLFTGLRILQIPLDMTMDEMEEACHATIEANAAALAAHDEDRLMINVSRGPLGLYAPIFMDRINPTVVIADFPLKWTVAGMAPLFDTGINAVIPSQRALPATLMDPKIKSRSRMWYQMANIEVARCEGTNNWALLIDPDGYITEGTGDNFFVVDKDGTLLTPEGRNILRGISRSYIFELAEQLGLRCKECNLEPYDVYCAAEAFMTATPFCILPVSSLNYQKIGDRVMGPVTRLLLETWSQNVGVDIQQQIRDYGAEVDSWYKTNAPTPYQFRRK